MPLPSSHRSWLQRIAWGYLFCSLAITALGLPFLYSAATKADFSKQIQWLVIGIALFVIVSSINYRRYMDYVWLFYLGVIGLLVLVLRLPAIRGVNRAIQLPGFNIQLQPAELLKVALILVLADYLSKHPNIDSFKGFLLPLTIAGVPIVLILMQPDLGTVMTLPALVCALLFLSGASLWRMASLGIAACAAVIPLWTYVLHDYQKGRVLAWINPELYAKSTALHMIRGLTAIAHGGFYGQGLGNGVLTELDMLPEKHNDFIFGVIAEEGGLIAAGGLIFLFLLLTVQGFIIAYKAANPTGRLIAAGVSAMIGGQALINIGVVTGLLPTTGITLPLVSYGGSSLAATFVMLGLVMSVYSEERNPKPWEMTLDERKQREV